MESAQLAPTTNISHTIPTDVNASSHSTGSMELAKLANLDGSTMLKLNAATKKTLAILLKPWLMEFANVFLDTEETPMDSVNLSFNAQPTALMMQAQVAARAIVDLSHNQVNAFLKFHASKTVSPRTVFATAMMDLF